MADFLEGTTIGGSIAITEKNIYDYLDDIIADTSIDRLAPKATSFEEYIQSFSITDINNLSPSRDIGLYITTGVTGTPNVNIYGSYDIPANLKTGTWTGTQSKLDVSVYNLTKSPMAEKSLLFVFNNDFDATINKLTLMCYHIESGVWYRMNQIKGTDKLTKKWEIDNQVELHYSNLKKLSNMIDELFNDKMDKSKNLADIVNVTEARSNLNIALTDVVGTGLSTLYSSQKLSKSIDDKVNANVIVTNEVKANLTKTDGKLADTITDLNNWTTKLTNEKMDKAQNLKDLANVTTARTNLGLGDSAIRDMTSNEGTSDTLVASQKLVGIVKVGLTKDIDDVRIQIVSSMAMGHNILSKTETHNTIFEKNKTGDVYIKSGNAVYNGSEWLTINVPIPIEIRDWESGNDYAVYVLPNKTAVAVKDHFNNPSTTPHVGGVLVGGFHIGLVPKGTTTSSGGFATSGNGMIWTNDDVDRISGVNEFSFWDLRFRGGGIVNNGGARDGQLSNHGFVYDPTAGLYTAIYHVSTDVDMNGLSMAGSNMASGTILPVIPRYYGGNGSKKYANMNWWTSNEIVSSQGARLMYEKEFNSRAFGVTENKVAGGASSTYPKTERINGLTSKIGAEQAAGTHYYWGLDSNFRYDNVTFTEKDVTGGRGQIYSQGTYGITRVLLGGHRTNALANVGSRQAYWRYSPWFSEWPLGAVAVRDLLIL